MQTYEKHKVVDQDDLDSLNHVNNVRYVKWVQDIAEEHWEGKASDTMKSDYYWVLLEHSIAYKDPALLGDVLKIVTYVIKSQGVKSNRKVEFYNQNTDQLLAESTTTWCLVSRDHNKPTRIPEEIVNLFS